MANYVTSYQTAENGKFIPLVNNTSFPPVSVVRFNYPDNTNAFPANSAAQPLSSVDVYYKYAVLSHLTNPEDIKVSLSAENINVSLDDLEDLTRAQNAIGLLQSYQLSGIAGYIDDLEQNTFDTASACDDTYHELVKINQTGIKYALDSGSIDAFGRLRASMPTTLFDSKTLHSKASLFWSQTAVGTGADVRFTAEGSDASVTLSAAGNDAYAIRQTTQRFNYQPGKSQLVLFTGILNPVSNAIKRYGIFQSLTAAPYTPDCGLYFETQTDSASSIAVVQQNDGYLVPSVSARREDWNIDKLDGTGPSGKTLSLSGANIFMIDYEWLGVGRVRYAFIIEGQICYCHAIDNTGNRQGAYIKTPNLPLRAELRQTGAGTASMKTICASVMSEGGADFTGVTRGVDSGNGLTIATGLRRAILGLRLQAIKLDSVNELINASIMIIPDTAGNNPNSAPYRYEIVHNPYTTSSWGVTGGTWSNVDDNSNFQYWRAGAGGNEPFNGTVIASGFGSVGATVDLSSYRFEKFLRLGCSIDGRRDEIYLVVTPLLANTGVYGSLTFIESD